MKRLADKKRFGQPTTVRLAPMHIAYLRRRAVRDGCTITDTLRRLVHKEMMKEADK